MENQDIPRDTSAPSKATRYFNLEWTKLIDNWPIEDERSKRLYSQFFLIWRDVGEVRFRMAVKAIIDARAYATFPTQAEFRGFIPDRDVVKWDWDRNCPDCHGTGWTVTQEYHDLPHGRWQNREVKRCDREGCKKAMESDRARYLDRDRNPDNYFGEADVIALMRIAKERREKGMPALDGDSMISAVLQVRGAAREARR
jgi:hypothetical protein